METVFRAKILTWKNFLNLQNKSLNEFVKPKFFAEKNLLTKIHLGTNGVFFSYK